MLLLKKRIHSSGWLAEPLTVTQPTPKEKPKVYFIGDIVDTLTCTKRQPPFSTHASSGLYWPLENNLLHFKLCCSTWKFSSLNKWSTGEYCTLRDKLGAFEEKYWKNAIDVRIFFYAEQNVGSFAKISWSMNNYLMEWTTFLFENNVKTLRKLWARHVAPYFPHMLITVRSTYNCIHEQRYILKKSVGNRF